MKTEEVYDFLPRIGFRFYSGDDGDLARKHNLPGYRIRVYWGRDVALQQKITDRLGTRWITICQWDWLQENQKAGEALIRFSECKNRNTCGNAHNCDPSKCLENQVKLANY